MMETNWFVNWAQSDIYQRRFIFTLQVIESINATLRRNRQLILDLNNPTAVVIVTTRDLIIQIRVFRDLGKNWEQIVLVCVYFNTKGGTTWG